MRIAQDLLMNRKYHFSFENSNSYTTQILAPFRKQWPHKAHPSIIFISIGNLIYTHWSLPQLTIFENFMIWLLSSKSTSKLLSNLYSKPIFELRTVYALIILIEKK